MNAFITGRPDGQPTATMCAEGCISGDPPDMRCARCLRVLLQRCISVNPDRPTLLDVLLKMKPLAESVVKQADSEPATIDTDAVVEMGKRAVIEPRAGEQWLTVGMMRSVLASLKEWGL